MLVSLYCKAISLQWHLLQFLAADASFLPKTQKKALAGTPVSAFCLAWY